MAGEADDADVEGEVLAAELGADAGLLGELEELGLGLEVAEGAAALVAGGGEGVVVLCGRELDGLEIELGGGAADDDGEVVGGQAAVPRDFIFSKTNFSRLAGLRRALVSWKR